MALSSTYQGTYTLVANGTNSSIDGGNVWWRWVTSKYERKWTFDGSIWNLTEGIGLQFLKNLEA